MVEWEEKLRYNDPLPPPNLLGVIYFVPRLRQRI